jgi:hypothetical protein
MGLAAVACFFAIGGYVAWQVRFRPVSESVRVIANAPPPVEVNGSAPRELPLRAFDAGSLKKSQAPLPQFPPPPPAPQIMAMAQPPAMALPSVMPPPPPPPPAAPSGNVAGGPGGRANFQVDGITNLDTGSNMTRQFEPNMDSVAARGGSGGAGRGGGGGGGAGRGGGGLTTTATLQGAVTDPGDAAVPNATIELRNTATGAVRTTVATPDGVFRFNSIAPAVYSLSVKAGSGFQAAAITGIAVTASEIHDVGRIKLSMGAVTEEVSVTAVATPVQTTSSENSSLADQTQVNQIAVRGRDLFGILQTVPGVSLGNVYLSQGAGETSGDSTALQTMQVNGGGTGRTAARPSVAWKFAPAVAALVEHVRSGAPLSADEGRFVKGGEAFVQLTLTNFSAESLDQLRKAGLTIMRQDRGDATGHIQPSKLEAVAELAFVMWIAPQ